MQERWGKKAGADVCCSPQFLGIDRDGACAEFLVVPLSSVIHLPDGLPWCVAALTEPVAAALAVLKANIRPHQSGIVIGESRITRLVQRVLVAHGFEQIRACGMGTACPCLIIAAISSLRRRPQRKSSAKWSDWFVRVAGSCSKAESTAIAFFLREMLPKEPVIEAVHYGDFDMAVRLLTGGSIPVDDLIGPGYLLEDYQQALDAALQAETCKVFLLPGGE